MQDYLVVAYVNDTALTFTLTARKHTSRLPEVTRQARAIGYRTVLIATRLDKATAAAMKRSLRDAYEIAGYVYRTRPKLP